MKITIHRGTDQIGGCVTEYEYNGFRLFVDYGEQLPGAKKSPPLEIEGLTKGDLSKSALLITHYHGDHIGCIKDLPKELPIYMGKLGKDIQLALSEHLSCVDGEQNLIIERLNVTKSFIPGHPFALGDFRITPVAIDHSAFDAYSFVIEANGIKVLHTGDFRMHGFRSKKLKEVIDKYIGRVDYVVCEGTNVTRSDSKLLSERELQDQFKAAFRQKGGHIIYLSSTNIDRLFSLYHAALSAGLSFFVDDYQNKIMNIVTDSNSLWGKAGLYNYGKYLPKELLREGNDFIVNDKFKAKYGKQGYVLIARANEMFYRLIEKLPCEKTKYLSMWKGYIDETRGTYNEMLAKSLGKDYKYLHTSGHCDMNDMRAFFTMLQPKAIIPIHTDNPNRFAEMFGNEWHVIRLHDGETFSTNAIDI